MPTDVVMPQMGESITEGTITKWLKKPGDTVQRDEPLFEISTDKVDAEIPSPAAGTLKEIKVAEGITVQINTVVCTIDEGGSAAAAAPPRRAAARKAETAATPADDSTTPAAIDAPDMGSPAAAGPGTDVVMPQMGESITEGTITKWLKKVGDTVQRDEPIFEISTDKVDAEIPSPVAGVLTEIKVPEGSTVTINTVVAVIGGAAGCSRGEGCCPAARCSGTSTRPCSRCCTRRCCRAKRSAPRRWSARSRRTTTSTSPGRRHRRCGPRYEERHRRTHRGQGPKPAAAAPAAPRCCDACQPCGCCSRSQASLCR